MVSSGAKKGREADMIVAVVGVRWLRGPLSSVPVAAALLSLGLGF